MMCAPQAHRSGYVLNDAPTSELGGRCNAVQGLEDEIVPPNQAWRILLLLPPLLLLPFLPLQLPLLLYRVLGCWQYASVWGLRWMLICRPS